MLGELPIWRVVVVGQFCFALVDDVLYFGRVPVSVPGKRRRRR